MKIACVGTGWYPEAPGGLEKYVYGLTHELVREGDELDLFLTGNPVSWDPKVRVHSIASPQESLLRRAFSARAVFRREFREPYDVVNMHFAMNVLPLMPMLSRRIPRVFHFHGPWAAESRAEGGGVLSVAVKRMLEGYVYHRIDRFITLSAAFKGILHDTYRVPPEAVTVIPMGIDTSAFVPAQDRAAVRRRLGWSEDKFVVFTARRWVQRVGLIELLQAAAAARDAAPSLAVKIGGKGPLEPELRRTIDTLGLGDVVELAGFLSEGDLVRAYQAADVTVLPTQQLEGFGTIIAESLACGTPVVATPVGGMPEALAGLDRHLIAKSPSAADIAELLVGVATGRLSLPGAQTCRAYALARFDWSDVARRVRDVFTQTASTR